MYTHISIHASHIHTYIHTYKHPKTHTWLYMHTYTDKAYIYAHTHMYHLDYIDLGTDFRHSES